MPICVLYNQQKREGMQNYSTKLGKWLLICMHFWNGNFAVFDREYQLSPLTFWRKKSPKSAIFTYLIMKMKLDMLTSTLRVCRQTKEFRAATHSEQGHIRIFFLFSPHVICRCEILAETELTTACGSQHLIFFIISKRAKRANFFWLFWFIFSKKRQKIRN